MLLRNEAENRAVSCQNQSSTLPPANSLTMPHSCFLMRSRHQTAVLLGSLLVLWANLTHAQAAAPQKLRIVGGLASVSQYTRHEEPFWSKELSRLSGGQFSADIVPFDRAGVPGGDMLRLIQLGVIPFGTTLMNSLSAQYPLYSAPDLAGLNPDMSSLRKTVAAFRPYLEQELREHHGIEALALYVYPAQVIFCKKPITRLADLAGRRIRVSSATQSDFIGALGGVPVLTGFAQVMPSLASGNTECAVTGTMSGHALGLHAVTTHLHTLPITWGLAIFGANQSAWNALPAELKALLRRELPKLEAAIWLGSERETAEGLACNKGAQGCTSTTTGHMVDVPLSAQDEHRRQEIFSTTVLPRWLQRCGAACRDVWNKTIGPVHGITAPLAP